MMRNPRSYDSAAELPLTDKNMPGNNVPYGSTDPYYVQSGYFPPPRQKKPTSKWIKYGIPVAIVLIIAVVVGVVVGIKEDDNSDSSSSSSGSSSSDEVPGVSTPSAGATGGDGLARLAVSTNTWFLPVYPSTTNTALYTEPTISSNASLQWPQDDFQPTSPSPTTVRPDRPRLIAPQYMWNALPALIAADPYLASWNASIFINATQYAALPPVVYFMDGSSGILDNCREVKERVKAFGYAYRMTNDTTWANRAYVELQNAAGNGSQPFGPDSDDKWNPTHFLDTGEMTSAFGIAYDWMYEAWSDDQKAAIRQSMIQYGLNWGIIAVTNTTIGWWRNDIQGNWNCVSNGGLTLGALAILNDDTTGTAEQILGETIDNAKQNCAFCASPDGTTTETPNYNAFANSGLAEMSSALNTATGSDYGFLTANPSLNATGKFHMAVSGATSRFVWGDQSPNFYSVTFNWMMYHGRQFNNPDYTLFQRDQFDAQSDPWSMFWYDPAVSGAFWDQLALDQFFDDPFDSWGSMRSSWTDPNAMYVAIKAGTLQGHQTHNDLDCGDFVIDALGTRWAGELGSGDYNSPGYFSNDTQDSQRWTYYRKRTEGQNTVLVNANNQNVVAAPGSAVHDSTGDLQGSSTVETLADGSTAYWIADLTSAYNDTTSFSRGVRMINNRQQILLQDEINTTGTVMWRMHTNATVTPNGSSATLVIGSQTMEVQILNPSSGATFSTMDAVRLSSDPPLPAGVTDQPNTGVTVLVINLPAGQYTLEVLFNPQWPGLSSSDYQTPPSVALADWSLTSHNSS